MKEENLQNLATKDNLKETNELIKANAKAIDRNAKTIDGNAKAISKIDHLLETTARQVVKNGEITKRVSLLTIDNAAKIKELPTKEEIDVKFSKVLNGQDKIIEKLDSLETEKAAAILREDRIEKKLEKHGKKIKQLETKFAIA